MDCSSKFMPELCQVQWCCRLSIQQAGVLCGSGAVRIGLLHFQGGCRKRQLNLALVFLCLFCLVVSTLI